jgi:hypothetical protein
MTNPATREFQEQDQAQAAFNRALRTGRLSHDATAPNWVGSYMFMGFDEKGRACFKHSTTRKYLSHEAV